MGSSIAFFLQSVKSAVAMSLLLGLIPLLMGLLFDLVVIIPLRVPLNTTPLLYLWHVSRPSLPSVRIP